jgi:hypothetical protein
MTQSRSALAEQARELRRHSILELLSTGYTNHRDCRQTERKDSYRL